ncbi:hypothetical protein PCANC_19370 [Puccinia coronata f. sp. avenae]|uniref:Uncharacterized protein n=1 Tax=Puccinia coronata f. sp. avenae TaxID=200324 RepID=A0A2N5UPS5_9BASI|nr:hypothetical protein PCANC_19370 [Puccinia coronata f. sp. avenae]
MAKAAASLGKHLQAPQHPVKPHRVVYEVYSQIQKSGVHLTDGSGPSHTNSTNGSNVLGQIELKIAALKRSVDASRAAESYLVWALTRG